ncbi:MAG TPA: TonB-dependent receptor, partial [Candidatus Acidoferrales bacterium]|nr:TonB-dependent receptor [Candidatus Acidoferrales bacterium]
TAGIEHQEKEARPKSLNVNFVPPPPFVEQNFFASRTLYAGYLQQQILLLDDRLIGTGGFRVDSDEDFGREVSASWSVAYLQDWDGSGRLSTRVKGGYNEGFKAPTFNELFFPGFGNPNLGPETSSEYDGGVVQNLWGEALTVAGTFFSRRTKNLIQGEPVCGSTVAPSGFVVACNVGRADVQGVETSVTVEPTAGLSMQGTYTYLDFNVAGPNGSTPLTQRPHNRMGAGARYRRALGWQTEDLLDLTTSVNYAGERHDVSGGLDPTYTVANAAVTYSFPIRDAWVERLGLFARVGNLFDRNYAEVRGFKSLPINFVAGTNVTF